MLTAGIRRADRAAVTAAVERWTAELASRAEVQHVVWYGSYMRGVPTPHSDADLAVVIRDDSGPACVPRHARAADYLPAFATPVPFDVAVLTASEHAALAAWAPAWAAALAGGRVVLAR